MKRMLSTWTKRSVTRTGATAAALTLAITALVVGPASPAMASWCGQTWTDRGDQAQVNNCDDQAGGISSWAWVWDGSSDYAANGMPKMVVLKVKYYDGSEEIVLVDDQTDGDGDPVYLYRDVQLAQMCKMWGSVEGIPQLWTWIFDCGYWMYIGPW